LSRKPQRDVGYQDDIKRPAHVRFPTRDAIYA